MNSRSQVLNKLKCDFREKGEKKEEVIAEKLARINKKEENLKVKEEDLSSSEEIGKTLYHLTGLQLCHIY